MRWCPAPDCNNAARVGHVDSRPVKCKCGHTFCFSCAENWHDPVKCALIRKWIKKCDDDSETSNWINANTKECPKCKATIEKDGGCNHMICKNQVSYLFPTVVYLKGDGRWNEHEGLTSSFRFRRARPTFAGCASGLGSRMEARGTTATDTTRTRRG